LKAAERSDPTTSMGQYLGRQTGHISKGNSWQRDMTNEGQQAERHLGLEVEVEGPGSFGSNRRHEEERREERRLKIPGMGSTVVPLMLKEGQKKPGVEDASTLE